VIIHGRGALECPDRWIFGYIQNRNWAIGSLQIVIKKYHFLAENSFGVFSLELIRPKCSLVEQWGTTYGTDGEITSGLFINHKLEIPMPVEMQASGFMGMSENCRYTSANG
jgi:hypothetical protein